MRPPDPMLLQAFDLLNAGQHQQALAIFHRLADQEDPGALATLAQLTWSGDLVAQDFERGRDYYHRAGEAGHVACAVYATNLLASGYVGARDWGQAIERLRREAAFDPARAEILALLARLDLTAEGDPRNLPAGERLSESPDIQIFRGAFSYVECNYLLRLEKPDYKRAHVIDLASGVERIDPVRTSEETHVHWLIENPLVHAFNRRLAAISGTRVQQGEPLQILRYRPGQQYRSHYDFIPGATNQRLFTALLYLNEDYTGGETAFPRLDLKVRGRTGDVLLFRNSRADGRREEDSEHAGLPVLTGVKHLATRWIRARQSMSPRFSGD
jgi:prolyl 4-hydroxylase